MTSTSSTRNAFNGYLERKLVAQIDRQPEEHATRVKLLDLYFETHRHNDFVHQAARLYAGLRERAATSPEWQRCVSMGGILDCMPDICEVGTLMGLPILAPRSH
jgi:hypothetical protein